MKIENYDFTTIPQLYRDAWMAHIKNEPFNFNYLTAMLKDKDPLGLIGWKTKLLNPEYGCNLDTFKQRLSLVFGENHQYSDDRLRRILDYKRPDDAPHEVNNDNPLSISKIYTLINYIKGREDMWDDDSLAEKEDWWKAKKLKEEDEAKAIETKRLKDIEEGTKWLRDHGVPQSRLDELEATGKLMYANLEEAKRAYPRLISELNTEIIIGKDIDLGIPMKALLQSIRDKLTDDDVVNRRVMRVEIKRLGQQFDEEYVKNAVNVEFGTEFNFSWTSAHFKRPAGCQECDKTKFIQAYPRILFNN